MIELPDNSETIIIPVCYIIYAHRTLYLIAIAQSGLLTISDRKITVVDNRVQCSITQWLSVFGAGACAGASHTDMELASLTEAQPVGHGWLKNME